MTQSGDHESFESFRSSFSYGSRSDLDFKFLKSLSDDQAAAFIQDVLHKLGDAYDSGDVQPLIEAAYEAQVVGYSPSPDAPPPRPGYDDGPFAPADKPMEDARVGLLTTSGHFVAGDDPEPFGVKAMTQEEAVARISESLKDTPVLSEIPSDTAIPDLRVRHGGYDIRSVLKDANVAFPIERLREARSEGAVGDLAPTFFSFPGATSQGRLRRELPGWITRIHEEDTDVMLLIPL